MRWPRPRTLFGRTLATIAFVAVAFQLFTIAVVAYYLLVPLGKRAAEDLAALMVNAAVSWQAADSSGRAAIAERFRTSLFLDVKSAESILPESESLLPYRFFVESSLERLTGYRSPLRTSRSVNDEVWFWADLQVRDEVVRVGFPRSRIDVGPQMVLLLVFSVGAWVSLLTAIALARRIAAPLEKLSAAAVALGHGQWPEPLPETGPKELLVLTRSFNRMTHQVRELVANRTTLLAGISHDLRTPLTQMRLAIEMLSSQEQDAELIAGIRRDLDNMNHMIGQFLEIGRELEASSGDPVSLNELLRETIDQFVGDKILFHYEYCRDRTPVYHALALRRILTNLLENALRYGGEEPVDVSCFQDTGQIRIVIADRGPGIPEKERDAVFRPFYRLENSRSEETGGSGLGLAVVKQLADGHGWRVSISDRPGGGAQACVTLPVSEYR
ncbi:MAG: two-component system sensor histidine kinase EnvZ [Gammaproteobacteria bacterium]